MKAAKLSEICLLNLTSIYKLNYMNTKIEKLNLRGIVMGKPTESLVFKLVVVLFLTLAVISCKKAENKVEAKSAEEVSEIDAEAVRYLAAVDQSTLSWKGEGPTKFHNGTIKISEGYLALDKGVINGGNFIIDMKTIEDESVENEEYSAKLEGHLASADFFDVEKHPFSAFAITGVDQKEGKLMVKGNLTVKNIKKNIEFPASLTVNGDSLVFKSEPFNIDRTEWDVKYNSGKFFEDLKDKLINDEIEFVIELKAKRS